MYFSSNGPSGDLHGEPIDDQSDEDESEFSPEAESEKIHLEPDRSEDNQEESITVNQLVQDEALLEIMEFKEWLKKRRLNLL